MSGAGDGVIEFGDGGLHVGNEEAQELFDRAKAEGARFVYEERGEDMHVEAWAPDGRLLFAMDLHR